VKQAVFILLLLIVAAASIACGEIGLSVARLPVETPLSIIDAKRKLIESLFARLAHGETRR